MTTQTRADRLVPLPENVVSLSVARRSWNGVCLDVITSHCAGRVAHHLCYESHTRLAALLEEVGSPCEPRLREHQPCAMPYAPHHLYFVPAGVPVWGYSADMRFVRDAVLTFDLETVGERLEQTLAGDLGTTSRLRFADERLWTLIKLLADVVDDRYPSTQLYGDGLTAAILARLMSRPQPAPARLARSCIFQANATLLPPPCSATTPHCVTPRIAPTIAGAYRTRPVRGKG